MTAWVLIGVAAGLSTILLGYFIGKFVATLREKELYSVIADSVEHTRTLLTTGNISATIAVLDELEDMLRSWSDRTDLEEKLHAQQTP